MDEGKCSMSLQLICTDIHEKFPEAPSGENSLTEKLLWATSDSHLQNTQQDQNNFTGMRAKA